MTRTKDWVWVIGLALSALWLLSATVSRLSAQTVVAAVPVGGQRVEDTVPVLEEPTPSPSSPSSPPAQEQAPEPPRVLFQDDFSFPFSGWPPWSSDPARVQVAYEGGEYHIVKLAGRRGAQGVAQSRVFNDFQAEIDARLVSPYLGTYLYLAFRMQQNGETYMVAISPATQSLQLSLWRLVNSEWKQATLLGWDSTVTINAGAAWNRLGVRAEGPEIVLLINGTEVGRLYDDTFSQGRLSFGVGNDGGGSVEGRFDNLLVTSVN